MEEGNERNTGSPVGGVHASTGNPRGPAWAGGVAERLVVSGRPGNAGRRKEPQFERAQQGGRDMETGGVGARDLVDGNSAIWCAENPAL